MNATRAHTGLLIRAGMVGVSGQLFGFYYYRYHYYAGPTGGLLRATRAT